MGRGGPKKFNMFNISPAGSIFWAFKPTKFNITAVGVIFLTPTAVMLNLVGFGEKKV